MLHLILGCAGSGKTHFVRQTLCDLAKEEGENRKLMLLVPEQYSFESERAMLHLLGPRMARQVEVMSFRRLADWVFRQYGHLSGKRLDDGGRGVLMSLALEQVGEQLSFYQGYAKTAELVSMLLSVSTEWKLCGISLEQFADTTKRVEDPVLQTKMQDIALILSAYDALVGKSYLDPLDDLERIRETVLEYHVFAGYTILVDSFKGFTMQEIQLLKIMIQQAQDVFVTLCADRLDDPENGMGLFSLTRRTARHLLRLAREEQVPVAAPVVLSPGTRFRGEALAHLERQFFRSGHEKGEAPASEVILYRAADPYEEAAFVAATIRRLVMEEGYRYRDFAIITRCLDGYRVCLDAALEQYEIPCFMDNPKKVDADPLMRLVLSAFQVIRNSFSSDDLFTYLKTGLVQGLSTEEISLLENYTFLWGISGRKWLEPWQSHPRGFVEEWTQEDTAMLERLNVWREQVVAPLEKFRHAIRDQDGEAICRAVYLLLIDVQADACLVSLCERFQSFGETALAEEQLRLWEMLMNMLDQTAAVLKEVVLPPQRFAELLRLVMVAGDISSIPQGLDEITVGEIGRMRPDEPKVVFVMGAVQGEFPPVPVSSGAFCDRERQALISLGLPLASTLEETALEERFLAYTALAAPSERLYVSWYTANVAGEAKSPSILIKEIRSIFPQVTELSRNRLPKPFFASAREPALELAAREYRENTPLSSTLKQLFLEQEEDIPKLHALDRAYRKRPVAFEHEEKAKELFRSTFHASATQIEQYHLCRFQYFCRYGLGARERRPAELNALEYGSLMHHLLEKLFGQHGQESILEMDSSLLRETILSYLTAYVEQKMGGSQDKTPRFLSLLDRLADSAQVVIFHIAEELAQSKFQPLGCEMTLRNDGDFPPLTISLPDGGEVVVDGVIDRVDILEENGEKYVRIVDYKTGKKEFRLSDILHGINMQMLIYMAAILGNPTMKPAGILYMPATRPMASVARTADSDARKKEVEKKLRMNGLLVDSLSLLEAMEAKGEGRYIPAAIKNGKPAQSEALISAGQLEHVLEHIKGLITRMAQGLQEGSIPPNPLKGAYDACTYCPYFAVCGHEKNEGGTFAFSCKKEQVLEQICKEEKEGEHGESNLDG